MEKLSLIKRMCMCLVVAMCGVVAAHANSTAKFDIVQQSKTYVTITGTGVRMRYGPGLNYGYYKDARGNSMSPKKGERLELLGQDGDWYEVRFGQDVAYVFKQYATVSGTKTKVENVAMVQVTGVGVRLRLGPGLNYDYLKWKDGSTRAPKKGERLVCIGETSDWYKVKYANGVYYIFKQYAKKVR